MQIKTLDGYVQNWQLTGHCSHAKIENKSSLHLNAREILKEKFPTIQILEEIPIPVRRSESYFLDFYIPMLKLAIEVHGEQHYQFNSFYHNSKLDFIRSQKRDREKKEWCLANNISFIELPYNENKEQWKQRILNDNSNSAT
jgi:hypothetical protein